MSDRRRGSARDRGPATPASVGHAAVAAAAFGHTAAAPIGSRSIICQERECRYVAARPRLFEMAAVVVVTQLQTHVRAHSR